ncbi:hypothetical protein ACLMJK_002191 [Lecanora helva]
MSSSNAKNAQHAPKKQTMTWDPETNQKLLLAILAFYGETKLDFKAIADLMGPNCTARAVQEQLKKLRKDAKANFDNVTSSTPGTAGKSAPDKGTPAKTPRAKATPKATKTPKTPRIAKTTKSAKQGKVAESTGDSEDAVPEKPEPARKKRKYDDPDATDAPESETIGDTMAEALHAASEEEA